MSRYQFSSQKNIFIFIMVCMLYHKLSVGHYSLLISTYQTEKKKMWVITISTYENKKTEKKVWFISIIFGNFC